MDSVQENDAVQDREPPNSTTNVGPTVPQRPSKKRTKTGCRTCRQRRIKCGEERPTCRNCIKSKRDCGGYLQPVVFKQPNGDIRIPGNDPGGVYHGTLGSIGAPSYYQPPYPLSDIQPLLNYGMTPSSHNPYRDLRFDVGPPLSGVLPSDVPYGYSNMPRTSLHGSESSQMWGWSGQALPDNSEELPGGRIWSHAPVTSETIHTLQSSEQGHLFERSAFGHPHQSVPDPGLNVTIEAQVPLGTQTWMTTPTRAPSTMYGSQMLSSTISASSEKQSFQDWEIPQTHDQNLYRRPTLNRGSTIPLEVESGWPRPQPNSTDEIVQARRYSVHGFVQQPLFDTQIPATEPPSPLVSVHQRENFDDDDEEDDPYDVEMEYSKNTPMATEKTQQELKTMLVKYASQENRRMRTFTTYLDSPSVLATYKPAHSASPLHDEKVGRIFCHFVSVTGPCLSVYERQASNSPITFSKLAVPSSQKMLWTYILPSIAIHHPALLHALLALSALHIAKIQKTSEDPSLKHFTYAVRRVKGLLGLPQRRHEIATLATVLLLGFYEVMSADHSRWNLHLKGAKDLVSEFDFARMARTTWRMRSRARANLAQRYASSYEEHILIADIPETLLNDADWEVDEELISRLSSFHIDYKNQWQPNFPVSQQQREFTEKEIEEYKIKSDLRWWYCKQDIFQSMISGDPLLMPFNQWIYCPPRAQIGKMTAAYGTMDHLCLIMARLTEFGGTDRARKQRVVTSQGGEWRPRPGFLVPTGGPPKSQSAPQGSAPIPPGLAPSSGSGNHDHASTVPKGYKDSTQASNQRSEQTTPTRNSNSAPSSVSFHGMMPLPTEPLHMPTAFEAMDASIHDTAFNLPPPTPEPAPEKDLDNETAAALAEHSAIVEAFDLFAQSLGPEFESLSPDSAPYISTPFGPALQYRTYAIACIWAFYYVGRILIHRLHPHMPPAAMISVGVTAHLTKEYAQIVGKICAGLYFPQHNTMQNGILNPHLGSALMESTFFLLFAAIQYQDPAQRGWTISKLSDIAEMTGWQTSASVAAACEVAWQKTGAAGRGPPYIPTMDRNNKDVRVRSIFTNGVPSRRPKEAANSEEQHEEVLGHDRERIDRYPNTRVHWALGLLSVEEDIAKLNLG